MFHVKQSRESQAITYSPQKARISFMAKIKLTREQIREGLEQVPMESLLRGASGSEVNLTAKQIAFAKELALGKTTKAGAYRKVCNTKAQPRTVSSNAAKLSTDQRIALAVESFKQAEAFKEYQTPTQLRALVVSQLTKHVLDDEFPPAQRVACLKLLGSVAEVGLFLDRKETLVVHQSSEIRERLLSQLKNVIDTQAVDITPNDDADSLLAEIAKGQDSDPTVPTPPAEPFDHPVLDIHTIPHESPIPESIPNESSIPHDEYPHGGETKQSLG